MHISKDFLKESLFLLWSLNLHPWCPAWQCSIHPPQIGVLISHFQFSLSNLCHSKWQLFSLSLGSSRSLEVKVPSQKGRGLQNNSFWETLETDGTFRSFRWCQIWWECRLFSSSTVFLFHILSNSVLRGSYFESFSSCFSARCSPHSKIMMFLQVAWLFWFSPV